MGCGISRFTETPEKAPKQKQNSQKNTLDNRRISKSRNKTEIRRPDQDGLDQAKQLIQHDKIEESDVKFQSIKIKDEKDLRSKANNIKNFDIFQKKITEMAGQKFTDEEFPPTQKSLTKDLAYMPKAANYQWTRAQEIYPDKQVKIFQGKIEPNDIKQGALGDCYFLSALSVLAERENLIEKLFVSKEVNQEGVYGIVMCIDGEFQEILVDDWIPTTKSGHICFSKCNDKDLDKFGFELWVLLIEKAYAKVYQGYNQIVRGHTGNAIRDLTGAPSVTLECKQGVDEIWDFLQYHESQGHMLTAGTSSVQNQIKEEDTGMGIVSGHAYAILQVKEVERDGLEKIIQVRNPWGNKEWQGDWSDNSSKWTDELKQKLNFTNEDDGIFWIKVEDFIKQFQNVTSNYVNESYTYDSIKIQTKEKTSILLKFNVKEDNTHAFLEITQKDQRHFEPKDKYNYSYARILCCSGDFQEWIGDNEGKNRNITLEGTFNKGTYIAWVDVSEPRQNFDADFITVSSYSDKQIQFSQSYEYKQHNETEILDQMLICQPPQKQEKVKTFEQDNNVLRYQGEAGGYVYFQFVNNSTKGSVYKGHIQMDSRKNLEIMYPYTNNEQFEMILNPKEAKIVKYTVTPNSSGAYSYSFRYVELVEESFDQLVQQAKEQSKSERKERQDWKIYFTQFGFKGGFILYYQNESDKTYEEQIKFNLKNLKIIQNGEDSQDQNEIKVVLKPGEDNFIILHHKDFSQGYSYSTSSSYKVY
ncbi:hypothetical protein PPERSA_09852 [Pseudocohnilembus persalinus]|uniref:Calpain catalytic domain-containing protein n=1 Tax=Pseudocohnilembus persalinus TaxID=266149 RepID=A0A0V0QUR0_PSEPJ|nr:hypothetical protein PPERSA_09852 [Pseudocohnilembus persalinus]|eukprot:KRX05712.1 hypothetical protein PPERSA_09852 [Pseudocohnilembus persalinus]